MNQTVIRPRSFNHSGLYFVGLLIISFLGFWKSYFSKFFDGTLDYALYFHFHAAMMILWTLMLIVQPILIKRKNLATHSLIGKASYVVMPLLLLSVLIIFHERLQPIPPAEITFTSNILPFRDFWFLLIFFTIAVVYRKNIHVHARAMIATGIVFIEPSLTRFLSAVPEIALVLILLLLITLSILDRKQKSGRWIFPSMLFVYIVVYTILIVEVELPILDGLVRWFARL